MRLPDTFLHLLIRKSAPGWKIIPGAYADFFAKGAVGQQAVPLRALMRFVMWLLLDFRLYKVLGLIAVAAVMSLLLRTGISIAI